MMASKCGGIRIPCTPEQRRSILMAYRAGVKLEAIAADHGISVPLVIKLARKAGLPKRPRGRSVEDQQEISRMYRDGVELKVIGEMFGISMAGADMARKRMGVPAYREKLRWGKGRVA